MKTSHHADPTSLIGFASGTLEEPFLTVLASHLENCNACRTALGELETMGGLMLEAAQCEAMSSDCKAAVLDSLDKRSVTFNAPHHSGTLDSTISGLPAPLARRLGLSIDDIPWKRVSPKFSFWHAPHLAGDSGTLTLFKIAKGGTIPEHGHGGREMTYIISGSYRDSFGRFTPGDIADFDEDVEHTPIVDSDVPCICAAATESPAQFKSWMSRLVQPILRI